MAYLSTRQLQDHVPLPISVPARSFPGSLTGWTEDTLLFTAFTIV